MTALIIIAAVLLLIMVTRVGASAEYGESGFTARVHVGPFSFTVFPRQRTQKKERSGRERRREKSKKEREEEPEKPGTLKKFLELWPAVSKALGRFRKKLLVNELTLWYMAASDDAYSAAMSFGYASVGAGVVIPLLESAFRIRKRDIRTAVSFTVSEPFIYVKLRLSLSIYQIVYIAVGFLADYLKTSGRSSGGRRNNQNGKAVIKNG